MYTTHGIYADNSHLGLLPPVGPVVGITGGGREKAGEETERFKIKKE